MSQGPRPIVVAVGIATLDQVFDLPEAPTRAVKYRAQNLVVTGGGTGASCAVAAARLGAEVRFFGALGDDILGEAILEGLAAEGVDCRGVRRIAGATSPLSAILVDPSGERTVISHSDARLFEATGHLPDVLPAGTGAVTGDTRWQAGAAHMFALARQAGLPAILDGDRAPLERPDLLTLASHLAFSAQGLRDLTDCGEDLAAGLAALRRRTDAWLAVTDGGNGVLIEEDGGVYHAAAFPTRIRDTLGAGDVWHGAFAVALAAGRPEFEAVRFANVAAALKCTRFGGRSGAPTRAEVDDFMRHAASAPAS